MLAFLWPALHLLTYIVRFGPPDAPTIGESLVFAPIGIVSGLALVFLWRRASGRAQRRGTLIAYLLMTPVAFVGSLLGGLLMSPILGVLLFGAAPVVLATAFGYMVAGRWENRGAATRVPTTG